MKVATGVYGGNSLARETTRDGLTLPHQVSKRLDELEKLTMSIVPPNQKLERARRTSEGESEPPNISMVTTAIKPSNFSCPPWC